MILLCRQFKLLTLTVVCLLTSGNRLLTAQTPLLMSCVLHLEA